MPPWLPIGGILSAIGQGARFVGFKKVYDEALAKSLAFDAPPTIFLEWAYQ